METPVLKLSCGESVLEVRLESETAILGERRAPIRLFREKGELEAVEVSGERHRVRLARQGDLVFVWCAGTVWEIRRSTSGAARPADPCGLLAPMPGRVRKTLVALGERVAKGQVLLILEAMKMEHAIRAPRDGVVRSLAHGEGELVEAGTVLAEITGPEVGR